MMALNGKIDPELDHDEYLKETDQWIKEAETYFHLFISQATRNSSGPRNSISATDAARASELCCQIAKARGLRTHW